MGSSHLVRQGDRTVGIEQKKWSFSRDELDPRFAVATGIFGQYFCDRDPPHAADAALRVVSETAVRPFPAQFPPFRPF